MTVVVKLLEWLSLNQRQKVKKVAYKNGVQIESERNWNKIRTKFETERKQMGMEKERKGNGNLKKT
jgi:hypothetical protein